MNVNMVHDVHAGAFVHVAVYMLSMCSGKILCTCMCI